MAPHIAAGGHLTAVNHGIVVAAAASRKVILEEQPMAVARRR